MRWGHTVAPSETSAIGESPAVVGLRPVRYLALVEIPPTGSRSADAIWTAFPIGNRPWPIGRAAVTMSGRTLWDEEVCTW